ncbi:hypothetical protein MHYP_G00153170 [Metynnis hypsauchen]
MSPSLARNVKEPLALEQLQLAPSNSPAFPKNTLLQPSGVHREIRLAPSNCILFEKCSCSSFQTPGVKKKEKIMVNIDEELNLYLHSRDEALPCLSC